MSNSYDPTNCSPPGSSVLGILQARILEWIAISSFRKSFWPRDHICVSYISCIGGQVLYHQHHLGSHTPHIPVCNTILAYSDQPHKTFFFWFLDMEIILLLFAIPFACSTLLQGQVLLFTSLEIIFFIHFFFFLLLYLSTSSLTHMMLYCLDFPGGSEVKESACNAGDLDSIPGSGRSPGEGNGNLHQYSCLENPMDGGAWWATVHRVAKSKARLSNFTSLIPI